MEKKKSEWEYLWLALYAFMGLGLELVLIGVIEPLLFGGVKSNAYTDIQKITHWVLTIFCWGIMIIYLQKSAKKNMGFNVLSNNQVTKRGIIISALLVVICIVLNALDWETLKIIGEFQKKSNLVFVFQYLYYFVEVMLVYLIVAFGQKFFETLLKTNKNIPWGGIVLCLTWGVIHFMTKGTLTDGLGTMAFSLIYGAIYLLLNRNSKGTYLALVLAFVI